MDKVVCQLKKLTLLISFLMTMGLLCMVPKLIYAQEFDDLSLLYTQQKEDVIIEVGKYQSDVYFDLKVLLFFDGLDGYDSIAKTYEIMIIRNHSIIVDEEVIFNFDNFGGSFLFEQCLPGDTLIIKDVLDVSSYKDTNQYILVQCFDELDLVDFIVNPNDYSCINTSNVVTVDLYDINLKRVTDDTFISNGGQYDLGYILNHYNVFSFNELEGTHIIGPVIVRDTALRTRINDQPGGRLVVSDYSQGVSSYIGNIKAQDYDTEVSLNYYFDLSDLSFITPILYTDFTNNLFHEDHSGWVKIINYVDEFFKHFIGPNNYGYGNILQNDYYIDFDNAKELLNDQSSHYMEHRDVLRVSPDLDSGYLAIDVGYNYIIENSEYLRVIDILFPEGYDPKNHLFEYNTNLHIEGTSLISSGMKFEEGTILTKNNTLFTMPTDVYPTINNQIHQYFPVVLVDGVAFDGGGGIGDGFEYGEGSGIVFNMPNLNSNPITFQQLSDIYGHIIAPNNDFYNYYPFEDTFKWGGGNLNGGIICNSFHAGLMEIHMWPYNDNPTLNHGIELNIEALKKVEHGNIEDYVFTFELDLIEGNKENISTTFPLYTTNQSNGYIQFDSFCINSVGTYSFSLKEVIEDVEGIVFDENIYVIQVEVIELDGVLEFKEFVYLEQQGVEDILFINKIIQSYDLFFTKVDAINGFVLEGAKFELKNTVTNEIKTVISDDLGIISFNQLVYDVVYELREIKAPGGYYLIEGYWSIYKDSKDEMIYIESSNDSMDDIVDHKIINHQIQVVLPVAGGQGEQGYYQIGGVIVVIGLMVLRGFYFINKRERKEYV